MQEVRSTGMVFYFQENGGTADAITHNNNHLTSIQSILDATLHVHTTKFQKLTPEFLWLGLLHGHALVCFSVITFSSLLIASVMMT